MGNHSFTDGRHWFDVLVDICNNTGEGATEFLQCFDKNLTLSSKKIIHGVDYLGKFTFEAAYPTWRTVFSPHSSDLAELQEFRFWKLKLQVSEFFDEYRVFIHDPDFFFLSSNPRSVPRVYLQYVSLTSKLQYIHVEKNSLLSRDEVGSNCFP